jgi:hypothetical protein
MAIIVFVSFVAHATTCIAQYAEFRFAGGQTKKEVRNLYQGQALNFLLPGRSGDFSGFLNVNGQRYDFPACRDAGGPDGTASDLKGLSSQFFRQKLLEWLKDGIANPGDAQAAIAALWCDLKENQPQTPFIRKLAMDLLDEDNPDGEDLEVQPGPGQMHKAFVPEKFQKWGKEQICALITFHEAEFCGGCLDASLQEYESGPFAIHLRWALGEVRGRLRIKGESRTIAQILDNHPAIIKTQDDLSVFINPQMIAALVGSFIQG